MSYRFHLEKRDGEAFEKVFYDLGIYPKTNREEITTVPCPKCGAVGRKCSTNMRLGLMHCFSCGSGFNPVSFLSEVTGTDMNTAAKRVDYLMGYTSDDAILSGCGHDLKPSQRGEDMVIEAERKSDEELNRIYTSFLSSLSFTQKTGQNLLKRGFTEEEIKRLKYRSFPDQTTDLERVFQISKSCGDVAGAPGFFRAKSGNYCFMRPAGGTAMPLISRHGQIVGIQIRKDTVKDGEAKCAWFSSKGKEMGTPAKAMVHYACDFTENEEGEKIPVHNGIFLLTEGIMKADLSHSINGMPFIAVPGVNATKALKEELLFLKSIGVLQIVLAYDMDYKTNEHVQKALLQTKELIKECGLVYRPAAWDEKTCDGHELKGIDDYLAYKHRGIHPFKH